MMEIFEFLTDHLGDDYWQGDAANPGDGLVEFFYSQLDEMSQNELPKSFVSPKSACRCLVSTIAFGLGMQITDVERVVHWGPPSNLLQYWQEVGRAGRDGRNSRAILYIPSHSMDKRHVDDGCRETFLNSLSHCIRKNVLKHLQVDCISDSDIEACCGGKLCCTFCTSQLDDIKMDS